MKMQTGTLNSYPVFPNWVFEGNMVLTPEISQQIINGMNGEIPSEDVHFGTLSKRGAKTKDLLNLTRLMGRVFADNVLSHFRLLDRLPQIESVDSQVITINPTRVVPASVQRHRWYQAILFLQSDENSSNLYFDSMDTKLWASPVGVQEYTHVITPEQFKVIFFPAHIPWGFTPNNSARDTVVYGTSFIIKN